MRNSIILAATLAVGALGAQSPLVTTFAGGNGLGAGAIMYFDLDAKIGLAITDMDFHFDGAAGLAASVNVYTVPTTWVGNETSIAPWTLAASGAATSNGSGVPTNVNLSAPIILSGGTIGMAVEYIGVGVDYTNGTTQGALFAGNAELDFFEGVSAGTPFAGGTISPRVFNGAFYYAPASGFASSVPYGNGCGGVQQYRTYYEQFAVNTFDLGSTPGAETVIENINTGVGYLVTAGAPDWFTPVSADLGLADDSVSTAQSLGFTATMPNGLMVTDLYVSSNGFVWLASDTNSDLSASINEFVTQNPRIAMLWRDLRPGSGGGAGTVHFDTDPANGFAYVTYLGIMEYANAASTIDMQLRISSSGNFQLRYGNETYSTAGTSTAPAIVGFSPGLGVLQPPQTDLSTVGTLPIITQPDVFIPNMSFATDRPIEGTTMNAVVSDIPAGSVLGTLVISGTQINPGVQPVPGLGSCMQYVGLSELLYFFPTGATETVAFPIPATGLNGFVVHMQAVTLSPGVNPLGVASSNGATLTVDMN